MLMIPDIDPICLVTWTHIHCIDLNGLWMQNVIVISRIELVHIWLNLMAKCQGERGSGPWDFHFGHVMVAQLWILKWFAQSARDVD